ncbi:MAG: type IV pilus twitching motility protein PilT [bacterium]
MDIKELLRLAIQANASDLHVKVGSPPVLRINGSLTPMLEYKRIMPEDIVAIASSLMNEQLKQKFKMDLDVDLAYGLKGVGRFRVNIFQQRGTIGIIFRVISFDIKTIRELNLPLVVEKLSMETRGLILVTGVTGSGKSTTLAGIIDYINSNRNENIITVEDPIEYLYRDKKSLISQREVGADARSFATALRSALRQDPDVILVGEMRDLETIETAITAAETGHLVLSTLHTLDATETINRVISVFPPYQQKQIRLQLASVIRGIISQRLVPKIDGKGLIPAVEVMVSTAKIRACIIEKDKTSQIREAMAAGLSQYGMQTFDQSLMMLYAKKLISYEDALGLSSNPEDFALKCSGIQSTGDVSWEDFEKNLIEKDVDKVDKDDGIERIEIEKF